MYKPKKNKSANKNPQKQNHKIIAKKKKEEKKNKVKRKSP